jgi:chloramphenicol-sensitive protein RarD
MSPGANAAAERDRLRQGFAGAAAAFGLWGFLPLYFKVLGRAGALEIVAHRIVWALVFVAVLLAVRGGWREVRRAVTSRRDLATFFVTALLIALNWVIFVWAVGTNQVLQISLGYFINPLVNVVLGMAVFGERLGRWQLFAVLLAAAGVVNQIVAVGELPWAALALAVSFAVYGLMRKTARVESLVGLALETAWLAPLAAGYLLYLASQGAGAFGGHGIGFDLLLLAAGPVTAVPLLCFAIGARRLKLSTLGLFQYLAPSLQFLLAILWFGEPFTAAHLVTFGLIWSALALYSLDSIRRA